MSRFGKMKPVIKRLALWCGLVLAAATLTGCETGSSASASYPEYDYWWR